MNIRRAGVALIILICTLAAMWLGLSFLYERTTESSPEHTAQATGDVVSLSHTQEGELHTFAGEVETPTPCHRVAAALSTLYVDPPQITIALTTKDDADSLCAQVVSRQPFSVQLTSISRPEVAVVINGTPRPSVIIEK